jgi:hypothetical protein
MRPGKKTMKTKMSMWPKEELSKIAGTDDLHISPFRDDGETYGTPTWIWSVVVDDALYVRGYNGQNSSWYKAAVRQKAGRIKTAGMTQSDDQRKRPRGHSQDHARVRDEAWQ